MNNIEINKELNNIIREAKQEAKLDKCIMCGEKTTSFCKSHSIPKLILKNITENGYLYTSNSFIEMPIIKKEKGINEAGTFNIICKKCDSQVFQAYENEEALLKEPTNKMMAEITIKNILLTKYKRNFEIKIYEKLIQHFIDTPEVVKIFEQKNKVNLIDISELDWEYNRAKKIIDKNLKSGYKLIFWTKLQYIVPIAFQGNICIYSDLNGNIINDIYDDDSNKKLHYININVFPLKECSVIFLYYHKDDNSYYRFEKQFNKLGNEEKLKLISYLLVKYTEEIYMSKEVSEEILKNEEIKGISKELFSFLSAFSEEDLKKQKNLKAEEISEYIDFINILDEKYKI